MPNYIDKEKLIRDLIDKGFYPAIVKSAIENAPTEDFVPRAEVEEAKQEVAREIFEEIEKALAQHSYAQCFQGEVCATSYFDYDLEDSIAELKKKYIGE